MQGVLLACDWGTTNLRAWTLSDDGQMLRQETFPLGVAGLGPGEASQKFESEVRPALGAQGLPAVLCGMIGADIGWRPVPYLDCPADLRALARALAPVGERVWIAPGLRAYRAAGCVDVMRGEETQVFGWLAQQPERQQGRCLVLHPGTHAKWVVVEDGRIVRFVTAMTGELFAVLRRHSILKNGGDADDHAAFDAGVAAAGDGSALAARLFSTRARVVGAGRPAHETPSYLSGLLIGAEVASTPHLLGLPNDQEISLLGDPVLCGWYARALRAHQKPHRTFDGESAAVAGLLALYRMETSNEAR